MITSSLPPVKKVVPIKEKSIINNDSLINLPFSVKQSIEQALREINKQSPEGKFLEFLVKFALVVSKKAQINPNMSSEIDYFENLVNILTKPEIIKEFATNSEDPLMSARLRGQQVKIKLLYDNDNPLSSEQVAQLLQITRQAVDKRRNQGKLLGLSLGRRGYFYPSWQWKDDQLLTGLDKILVILKEYDNWTKLMFLKTGDIQLGGKTPLECLQADETEAVIKAAECYGKHTAS